MSGEAHPTRAPRRRRVPGPRTWPADDPATAAPARASARSARRRASLLPDLQPGDSDDDLMGRFRSLFIGGVLAFRALFAVPPLAILLAYNGVDPLAPLVVVWALLVVLDLSVIPPTVRRETPPGRVVRWLVADVVVGVVVNLATVPLVPGPINEPYHDLFWFWFMGSAVLWTAWIGARGGIGVVLLTLPVQIGMTALSDPQPAAEVVPMIIGRTVWLLAGVLVGTVILAVVRLSARSALALGVRAGRQSEQIRVLRDMHDTALQTLEAIGLTAEDDSVAASRRLRTVARAAREQAAGIRATLVAEDGSSGGTEPEDPGPGLVQTVRAAAAGLHNAGTDIRWHGRRIRGVRIPRQSAEALRSGVREALTNVQRHAEAGTASVRAAALPDRVEVVVRDDGHGFDVGGPTGFGIEHSIVGRLREAGGGATIRSGRGGTTVTLWVPR